MKPILQFTKATITGGIIFLFPVVLMTLIISKGYHAIMVISDPLANMLDDKIGGFDGRKLLAILLLILICFISGLLVQTKIVQQWFSKMENKLLVFIPGYALTKSILSDALGDKDSTNLIPILIRDENIWNLAFLIEEGKEYSTVFVPDAPRHDAGEVRIIKTENVKKIPVTANKFSVMIKNYGAGTLQYLDPK